jgi:hypothetical protein
MEKMSKLSKVVFAKQMETLNAFYVNLKVDLDNPLVVNVWYRVFENIDDKTFEQLIESYCLNNIYPPQSPTHLIQHMKDMALQGELSGEEAWEIAYESVKKHHYAVEDACTDLSNQGKVAIANSLKEMKSRFRNLYTDDIPYVRKDFIEIYKRVVTQQVNQKVMIGDTSILKIGSGE